MKSIETKGKLGDTLLVNVHLKNHVRIGCSRISMEREPLRWTSFIRYSYSEVWRI